MADPHFPTRPAESVIPLPEEDLLDLDFDFDSTGFLDEAFGLIDVPMDSMLDQQYGAVAALATQGAVMRPVLSHSEPGTQQAFQRDWRVWDTQNSKPDLPPAGSGSSADTYRLPSQPVSFHLPSQGGAAPSDFADLLGRGLQGLTSQAGLWQSADATSNQGSAPLESASSQGSGGQTGSALERGMTEQELRLERTKQKNKRAQKKFRQKQKDKQEELERSAAEMAARLKRTLGELDVLQNQKKVLEIAISRGAAAAASSSVAKGADDEPVFVPAKGFEMFSSRSGILLEVLFDPPRKLSHEQAIRLSLKDHARIWREVCRQASELLKSGEEDIESPSGKRLRALLNERHGLLAWTSVNNPVIMHKLMTSKLVDPPVPDTDRPGPDGLHRILEALKLSPEQETSLLRARRKHLTEVGHLLEERRRLQGVLKGLDTGFKSRLGDKARTHVLWAEAIRALQENVDAFHISHCVSMVSVFNPLMGLSVFQEARLLVQSFPHVPDICALLKELATMAGEPSLQALLQEGAARSTGPVLPAKVMYAEQEPYVSLEHKMESAIAAAQLEKFVEKLH